jgi:hypothetical protein
MTDPLLTYQRFNDMGLAEEMAGILREHGIECEIEDNGHIFNPSFVTNTVETAIDLKLRQVDFLRADKVFGEYYKARLESVDKTYYLFDFTDQELDEIIAKPDEWGKFDYQLAQKILKDRGKEISPEKVAELKTVRIGEIARPATVNPVWILLGYLCALFGGLFGLGFGLVLRYFKKTLPDGRRVYAYNEKVRLHGRVILYLSIVCIILWYSLQFYEFVFTGLGFNYW